MFGQKRIPSREGGVEVVVEELATRMVERGHDVTCINRNGHHSAICSPWPFILSCIQLTTNVDPAITRLGKNVYEVERRDNGRRI